MSKMKHLLRKLHIGGGSVNDHHNRLGETRHNNNNSNSNNSTNSSSTSTTPSSVPPTSSSSTTSSSASSTLTFPRTRAVDASDSSVDFNFFEEEFQVQLALAISASDPDAREDPELVQIKAAQRMSLGCPPSVAVDETLVDFLSLRYWNYNVVNYDEKVVDGFYDVYGTSNSSTQGKMPLLVDLQAISTSDNIDYGVILVNRSIDSALQQLERRAVSLSMECQTSECGPIASGLVQKIADLVVNTMGGPVADADEMIRRWIDRSYELRSTLNTIVLPLGCFDIGLSRHRALLFKVLADRINLPCRLVKGSYYTGTDEGAVNLIKIGYECEYIIDLMGAPGALIPAEIPSNHLEETRLDVMSSAIATVEQTVKDSCLALDKVNLQSENKNGTLEVGSLVPDVAPKAGCSGSNEASGVSIQSKGKDVNPVEKNQTERFEHEFGKLLPSLRKSREGLSGTGGKASSAQKMKVKDVSKYVISAAQNPEFAQKLHAVLLESGASPPPDLFSDIAPPREPEEQKVLVQSRCKEGEAMDEEAQRHHNTQGCGSSEAHFAGDTNFISQGGCLHFGTTNEGYVLVDNRFIGTNQADSMDVGMIPVKSSTVIRGALNEGRVHEQSMPCASDSCQKQQENVIEAGGVQCSQGNAGRFIKNLETQEMISSQDCQKCNAGAILKLMETANNDPHNAINGHNERISPMLDDVSEWEIPWEGIQIGERIGLGSYGEVYRADWNGTEVAVKKFLDQDLCGDALEQFRCEIRIMLRLRHPNVVLFMGAVTRPPNLSILTEFLPRGSLYRLLHRPNIHLDEKRRLRMALDVAKGMNYLHTSHPTIVHRDLKSPNLLVDKNWVVKVCDFGLSRLKHHTFLSSKSTAGTPEWMAPEVLRNEPSNEKCDVYSFGVILWELATLRMPWSGMNPMQVVGAVGFQNRRLEIPEEVDPAVAQIICDCWQSDPNLRPSFSQLMSVLKRLQHLVVEKT
ncbi:Protein kinase domain [Macleaya cordata]|uniref:non-specific serine/threonine protein kinase n=1 Tax=Macleaya cordata TaxID=56857 RepID=A0A200QD84_MACCD|nr:Protein kinase domain [Macleaya cordata]